MWCDVTDICYAGIGERGVIGVCYVVLYCVVELSVIFSGSL